MWWLMMGASILVYLAGWMIAVASLWLCIYINDPKLHSGWEFVWRGSFCAGGFLMAAAVMWAGVHLVPVAQ